MELGGKGLAPREGEDEALLSLLNLAECLLIVIRTCF